MAFCQTSNKSYFHRRKKKTEVDPGTLPGALCDKATWFASEKKTKELNRQTYHSNKLRGIQILDPNWLSRNTVGAASIVYFLPIILAQIRLTANKTKRDI